MQAQTTQPQRIDHDRFIEQAAARPLARMELRGADGKPLKDKQAAEIARADQLFAEAEASREAGDFAVAADKAKSAFEIRAGILGPRHFSVVSAGALAATMNDWSKLPPSGREEIAAADRQVRTARQQHEQGQYAASAQSAGEALRAFETLAPANLAPISAALLELGRARTDLSQHDAAEEALARSLELSKKSYGEDHPHTAAVLNRIGWLRFNQARRATIDSAALLDKGLEALSKSTQIYYSSVGETAEFAEALDNRGTLLLYAKKGLEALAAKYRALVIRKQLLGPEHKEVGVSHSNIALVYETQGVMDIAVENRRSAAKIFEAALGPEHPYSLLEKSNLARLLLAAGQTEAAIPILDELASVSERQSAEPTPDVLTRAIHLCGAFLAAGKIDKALLLLDRALEQAKTLYAAGEKQPAHLALIDLFRTADHHRLQAPALRVLSQVVAWDEAAGKASGQDSVDRILRSAQLGELQFRLRRFDEAKKRFEEAVSRTEALKGGRAIELAAPLMYLSELLEETGDLEGAERACDKALQIAESQWGRASSGTAHAMLQLAALYTQQNRFDMAEILLDDVASAYEKLQEKDAVGAVRLLRERARLLTARGKKDEAVARLKEALELAKAWQQSARNPRMVAEKAELLRDLLETADAGGAGEKGDREGWRAELRALLQQLEAGHALTVEEQGWLKELGDDTK